MKKFFKFALMCTALAATVFAAGCTPQEDEPTPEPGTKEYAIEIADLDGGTIEASVAVPGDEVTYEPVTKAAAGTIVNVEFTPDNGSFWSVKEWSFEGFSAEVGQVHNFSFTMPAKNVRIDADLEERFPINIEQGISNGSIMAYIGGTAPVNAVSSALEGQTVILVATPTNSDTHELGSWDVSDNITLEDPEESQTTFTMPAEPVDISAEFVPTVEVYVFNFSSNNEEFGRLSAEAGGYAIQSGDEVAVGTKVQVNFMPEEGCNFVDWEGNITTTVDVGTTIQFNMPAQDVTLVGNFAKPYKVIFQTSYPEGTVKVSNTTFPTVNYNSGDEFAVGTVLRVIATPAQGYEFVEWVDLDLVDVVPSSNFMFPMPDHDVTLTATFRALPLNTVTYETNFTGGTLKVTTTNKNQTVASGTVLTSGNPYYAIATPAAGYEVDIDKLTITTTAAGVPPKFNNKNLQADGSVHAMFMGPGKPVTISVEFKEKLPTVSWSTNIEGGTVWAVVDPGQQEIENGQGVEPGALAMAVAKPAEGYEFESFTGFTAIGTAPFDGNGAIGAPFMMPATNVVIGATFKKTASALPENYFTVNGEVFEIDESKTILFDNFGWWDIAFFSGDHCVYTSTQGFDVPQLKGTGYWVRYASYYDPNDGLLYNVNRYWDIDEGTLASGTMTGAQDGDTLEYDATLKWANGTEIVVKYNGPHKSL